MKFYRNERIEEVAEQRLREFEGKLGRPLSIPVDIELFGDLVLGLSMLWENIDELPGERVFVVVVKPFHAALPRTCAPVRSAELED
jgi:hypothetical protein